MAGAVSEPGALLDELAEARAALSRSEAERESQKEAARRALQEAKDRAKALFLERANRFQAEIAGLRDEARAREDENARLKEMLREADAAARAAVDDAVALAARDRDAARAQLVERDAQLCDLRTSLEDAREQQKQLGAVLEEERRKVQQRVRDLGNGPLSDARAREGQEDPHSPAVASGSRANGELSGVVELDPVSSTHGRADVGATGPSGSMEETLRSALARANARLAELQESLRSASVVEPNGTLDSEDDADKWRAEAEELRKSLQIAQSQASALQKEKDLLSDEVTALKTALSELQSALAHTEKQAEAVAAKAREDVKAAEDVASRAASSSSFAKDEQIKVLEAKVLELETSLAAKQSEIGKVRDKARAYLKDMTAQRREAENKLREEIASLTKRVEEEGSKVVTAEEATARMAKELDGCLGVISEKQKAVQSLNMAIANERAVAKEAQKRVLEISTEFDQYKDRARDALAERDAKLESSSGEIDSATESYRAELVKALEEARNLRSALKSAKSEASENAELLARATRAEAALELLKTDASSISSANISRIDALEEELDSKRMECEAFKSASATADSQLATAKVRLEVSERSLKSAEAEAEEARRVATASIERLQAHILSLEGDLREANASAASAHRTAAVAARAMALPATDGEHASVANGGEIHRSASFQSERASVSSAPVAGPLDVYTNDPFSPRTGMNSPRPGSESAGASRSVQDLIHGQPNSSEVSARDDQIAVLVSQIAELGVLLEEAQHESACREQQVNLLKSELKDLQGKLTASTKLQSGTPYELLRTTVVHYMRTGDPALLPVLATVLGISESEMAKVREARGDSGSNARDGSLFSSMSFFGRPSK